MVTYVKLVVKEKHLSIGLGFRFFHNGLVKKNILYNNVVYIRCDNLNDTYYSIIIINQN